MRTHELPEFFGGAFATVKATSDAAFRRLIEAMLRFYGEALFNPQWGEQIAFRPGNVMTISMVFQGLGKPQVEAVWRPFLDWVAASPQDFSIVQPLTVLAAPARQFWNPEFLKQIPGVVIADDRPGAPQSNIFWAGNLGEAGQVLHGYQSAWLPAGLLQDDKRGDLVEALFAASRHWGISLHTNKGLAGAPEAAIATARGTAINPAVLDAFALLISGAEEQPAYPGIPGHEPDTANARRHAEAIERAMSEIRSRLNAVGSYLAESNYFQTNWQQAFWGANYDRLRAVKARYDPDGLFTVHHGVGSEEWSPDGFTRSER